MSTVVVVKYPGDERDVTVNFQDVLAPGELIANAVITGVSPDGGLAVLMGAVATPTCTLRIGTGIDGRSYGVNITVTTDLPRAITRTVAVVINSQMAYDYPTKNPEAFNTLIGTLQAGQAAIGVAGFMFPYSFDPAGGYVTWELIDSEGTVYSQGNAYDYTITTTGANNKVEAHAVINAPSELAGTMAGQKYQIRWKLTLNGTDSYAFEQVQIADGGTSALGVEDVVEIAGENTQLSIGLDRPYERVGFELYYQNQKVLPFLEVLDKSRSSDGWTYRGIINTANDYIPAKLEAYDVLWTYWNNSTQTVKERQTGRLFMTNTSILSAIADMRILVNKSYSSINGTADVLFSDSLLLAYLRRGRDSFNGAYGMLTAFDMTNAQGSIREYWLRCSEILALRAQYLAEGEKVFNFSGQAITLDVDRTAYYDSLASTLQSQLDSDLKVYKQNLIKKGILGGDGNLTSIAPRHGSIGAVGITVSPASGWGGLAGRMSGGLRGY